MKLKRLLLIGFWQFAMAVIVFGFAQAMALGADVQPGDSNIKYFGRWDRSDPGHYSSYWGGAYIKVNFSGTTAGIKLGHRSNFYVKIDGGAWTTYTNANGTVNLTPVPLAGGTHSLSVAQGKDYDYNFIFEGLTLDAGGVTSPPQFSSNLIEFIGDSITAGYTDPQANVSDYAWACAEDLNCEHVQVAYPGVNLVSGFKGTGMDVQYFKKQSFKHPDSPDWDFTNYTARLVVINLGQNDGGANHVPGNIFQKEYTNFLANVRAKYPNADIFAMRVFLGFMAGETRAAVEARNAAGDLKVHFIDTTGWLSRSDYNDGVHPSAHGQAKAGHLLKSILAPYLRGDVVRKVTVGYQGWFSAPGDGSPANVWGHDNLEMWPDTREYSKTYKTRAFTLPNGQPARMFSSYDDQVVQTHFKWMAESGIDCAALQRFANELEPGSNIKAQRDGVALKVMKAAEAAGIKFYIMYDVSGWGVRGVKEDWNDTIKSTLHLISSPAYARQNNQPVVCIYGMGYVGWPATPEAALDTINWFKAQGCYVIGSVPGQWRAGDGDSRPNFEEVYNAFDMLSAWAVGRRFNSDYVRWVRGDQAYCQAHNIEYQPCLYPGTSFHNSNGSRKNLIPRNHGDFLWSQFATLKSLNLSTVYLAMFDELNEATSIFKCAEDASMMPTNKWFLPLDADGVHVSSDFYLRLVKDGSRMVKGIVPYQATIPTAFVPRENPISTANQKSPEKF